jgi:hypothetical protein
VTPYHSSPITGRVADLATLQHTQLAENPVFRSGVHTNDMQSTHALSIETSILCKALTNKHGHAASSELANSPGIVVKVSRGETLVSRVKKRIVTSGKHDRGNIRPLFPGWVNTSGIMRARMQEEYRLGGSVVQHGDESLVVQTNSLRVIVRVFHRNKPNILQNSMMVNCITKFKASFAVNRLSNVPQVGLLRYTCLSALNP